MKKLSTLVAAALLLTACSQSTEDLFAESIRKGSEAEGISLSNETSTCIAQKGLPLMNEEVLKEKINSGENYELDEPGLMKETTDSNQFSILTLTCLNEEELAVASNSNAEKLDCYFAEAGSKEKYIDIIANQDIVALTEIDAACSANA